MSYQEVNQIIDQLNISNKWKDKFKQIHSVYNLNYLNGNVETFFMWKPREEFKKLGYIDKAKFEFACNGTAFFFGPFYYLFKGMWLQAMIIILLCIIAPTPLVFLTPFYCYYSANFDFFRHKLLKSEKIRSNPQMLDDSFDRSILKNVIQKPIPLSIKLMFIMVILMASVLIYTWSLTLFYTR